MQLTVSRLRPDDDLASVVDIPALGLQPAEGSQVGEGAILPEEGAETIRIEALDQYLTDVVHGNGIAVQLRRDELKISCSLQESAFAAVSDAAGGLSAVVDGQGLT